MRAITGVLVAFFSLSVAAQQVVRIGAAHFPPYTVRPEQGGDTGLLSQLIAALNQVQGDYRFVMVPTSIPRRFRDFQEGRIDMAIFENPDWGWRAIDHVEVDLGLEDAEIFVARNTEGRQQDYFATLQDKRLALFSGYHYAFAGFNADPKYLAEHYNSTLTYSHDSNLLMVQRGRADIALVTRSYLSDYLIRNPGSAGQFLASERVDQVYHHYALLRPGAPISGGELNALLQRVRGNGDMLRIFQPYRITVKAPGQ
ncbi:substrate-binding periplasmic protein [Pseudomonas akapageensis]|uniref:substrate-binding periplasmic protein n=1 Tax=Pseudomonas akapageensis TaxID=2609961 RepID=UPI003CCD1F3D